MWRREFEGLEEIDASSKTASAGEIVGKPERRAERFSVHEWGLPLLRQLPGACLHAVLKTSLNRASRTDEP